MSAFQKGLDGKAVAEPDEVAHHRNEQETAILKNLHLDTNRPV